MHGNHSMRTSRMHSLLSLVSTGRTACVSLHVVWTQIPDMTVQTATAPANFISPVTFAGFTFAPRQKFYQVFQDGTLAKLSVRALLPCTACV